jgi:CPA2 family monovalent cation:H+ antiporter-2
MRASIALLLELGLLLVLLSVLGTIAPWLSLTPIPLYLLPTLARHPLRHRRRG